jgi:hypothetical protein
MLLHIFGGFEHTLSCHVDLLSICVRITIAIMPATIAKQAAIINALHKIIVRRSIFVLNVGVVSCSEKLLFT